MMKRKNISIVKFLVLLAVLTLQLSAVAQTYPVQTNVSATGPYYNYLSYYGDENNHLQAIVTLTDFNSGPVQARLRIRIEGPGYEAYTNPNLNVGVPFTLEPGVPNFIQGFDLAPYLQASNLIVQPSGVNLNKLPEGFTTVCIDVIRDGTSAEVLSTNNCTAFYLQLFQPSQAVFPVCASNLNPDEQFYTFQWTPPIGYVPSFGSELNYTFSLYEWNDPNNYNIFETGQGLVYQAQTMNAMLQFSQFDVLLQEGTDYVWRIESEISNNGMPVDMIQNNGLSEICTFTYGESLTLEEVLADGLMIDINADGEGERKGKAYWTVIDNTPGEGLSDFDAYIVEYRKKPTGNEGFELTWFEDTVPTFNHFIYQLEPSTTYEVNVRGMVGPTYSSDRSNTVEFTTSDPRVYGCGEADLPFLAQTYTPLENALAGMQFEIGQFTMRVTEIQAKGAPGHYEGKGVIPIAFLGGAKAKVRFDDILVDNQFVVREGQIDVVTDGLDNWLHQQYGQFVDPIYVNGTVDSAYVDTVAGSAWVVVDGIPLEFVFEPADYPIIINDESGYQYTIWPNGTIQIGTYLDYSNDYLDVGANDVATFAQSSTEVFGFDAKEHMEWHENYEVILLSDSTHYFVANKSLGAGSTQNGRVNVVLPAGVSNPSFEINGTQVSGFSNGVLTLPSDLTAGEHALYVIANNLRIGKLNLIVYAEKIKEVVIVPMTSVAVNETAIATAISQTFGEANITVNLTVAPQWNDSTYTNSKAIVLPQDVGVMNKYSDDMRDLRDAYFDDNPNADKGKYYLFVVPSFSDNTVDGYMVRGRALGFVASGASPGTYAHELGHGIGALAHSWKDNGPSMGTTNNLMDYSVNASELTKAQWKEFREVDLVPGMFDGEEDAANVIAALNDYDIPESLKNPDGSITFLSPAVLPISLKGEISELIFETFSYFPTSILYGAENDLPPFGALIGFTVDGVKYLVDVDENNQFLGYESLVDSTYSYYTENFTSVNIGENAVVGLPVFMNNEFGLGLVKSEFEIGVVGTNNKGAGGVQLSDLIVNTYCENLNANETHVLIASVDASDFTEELLIFNQLMEVIDQHEATTYPAPLNNQEYGHYFGHSAFLAFKMLKLIHDNKDYYPCASSIQLRLDEYFNSYASGIAYAEAEDEYLQNQIAPEFDEDGYRIFTEEYTPGNDGRVDMQISYINSLAGINTSFNIAYYNHRDITVAQQKIILTHFFKRQEGILNDQNEVNTSFIDGLISNLYVSINNSGNISSSYRDKIYCVFYGLTSDQRLSIMDYAYDLMPTSGSLSNNSAHTEVILWAMNTAPPSQLTAMINWLKGNDYNMFEELVNEVSFGNGLVYQAANSNSNQGQFVNFIAKSGGQIDRAKTILGKLAKYKNQSIIEMYGTELWEGSTLVKVLPLYTFEFFDDGSFVESDYIPGENKYRFEVSIGDLNVNYNYKVDPFDLVLVKVRSNISTSVATKPDGSAIHENDEFLIPAVQLDAIIRAQELSVYNAGIKFAAEAALIVFSGGGSIVITTLETVVLATQVVLEHYNGDIDAIQDPILKNRLLAIRDYSDFVMVGAGLTDILVGGITRKPFLLKANVAEEVKYTFNRDEFGWALRDMKSSGKLGENINRLETLIQSIDGTNDITLLAARKHFVSFKASTEFYKLSKYSGDHFVQYSVLSGKPYFRYVPNLNFPGSYSEYNLFDADLQGAEAKLTNIDWVPANSSPVSNVLSSMEGVKYVNTNGQLVTGDLEIVRTTSHQVYVRVKVPVVANGAGSFVSHVDIQASLSTILNLKNTNKLTKSIGSANDIELAAIHRYTEHGGVLNTPMRNGSETVLGPVNFTEFEAQVYQHTISGLVKLRQTNRLVTGTVIRGRTYSLADYNALFNSGSTDVSLKGMVSCTKNEAVAIDFLTTSGANISGTKVKVIMKIKSKNGVDIDDMSDWGVNLVNQRHPGALIQEEVLLEEGMFKMIGQPKPILENGVPKYDPDGVTPWIEIELEELSTPLRTIN
jgi:hypothetical protein